jgi:hypothetical protein
MLLGVMGALLPIVINKDLALAPHQNRAPVGHNFQGHEEPEFLDVEIVSAEDPRSVVFPTAEVVPPEKGAKVPRYIRRLQK